MERIDKIISEQTYYTRKETKKLISQGMVYVNGEQVKKAESKYEKTNISLKINGIEIKICFLIIPHILKRIKQVEPTASLKV